MNILYWFIEGQTHQGMPRGAKVSEAFNDLKQVAFHSNTSTTSKDGPQVERDYGNFYAKTQWEIIGDQLRLKVPLEIKDNSSVVTLFCSRMICLIYISSYTPVSQSSGFSYSLVGCFPDTSEMCSDNYYCGEYFRWEGFRCGSWHIQKLPRSSAQSGSRGNM